MAASRIINFPGQGEARFWAATGANYVAMRADDPVTTYTITWPGVAPAGARFVQMDAAGAISYVTGASGTLDDAYDSGGAGGGRLVTIDGGAVELTSPSPNVCLVLNQNGVAIAQRIEQNADASALVVNKNGTGIGIGFLVEDDGTGGSLEVRHLGIAGGDAASIDNDGTGRGLFIDQDGAAIALSINQASAFPGIEVTQVGAEAGLHVIGGPASGIEVDQGNDNRCLTLAKTGLGAGECLFVDNDGTGPAILARQDGAGIGFDLDQNGAAIAFRINQATAFRALEIAQLGDANALNFVKSTGTQDAAEFTNSGTGGSTLTLTNSGVDTALFITNSVVGNAIQVNHSTDQIAIAISSTSTDAIGLQIDSESDGAPLINLLPITGNARGDIAFGTARTADASAPSEGDMWYNATDEIFRAQDSAATLDFGTNTFKIVADPGDAGTITPPINSNFRSEFTNSTGSQTRVLANPGFVGQRGILTGLFSGGGTDTAINQPGAGGWQGGGTADDTATWGTSGESMEIVAISATEWRESESWGIVFS